MQSFSFFLTFSLPQKHQKQAKHERTPRQPNMVQLIRYRDHQYIYFVRNKRYRKINIFAFFVTRQKGKKVNKSLNEYATCSVENFKRKMKLEKRSPIFFFFWKMIIANRFKRPNDLFIKNIKKTKNFF